MKTRRALVGIVALCIAVGCNKKEYGDKAGGSAGSGETSAALKKLIAAIPGDALLVGMIDSPKPLWDFITSDFMLPMIPEHRDALEKELKTFLDERLGIDVLKSQAAAFFVHAHGTAKPKGAILIGGVSGSLKGDKAGEYAGTAMVVIDADEEVVAATKDGTMIIGPKPSVEAVLDLMAGKGDSLAKSNASFHTWLTVESKGAAIGAVANVAEIAKIAPLPFGDGLEFAAVNFSARGIRAVVTGNETTLAGLNGQALAFLQMARGQLEVMKSQMSGPDVPAALGAMQIIQYHLGQNVLDQIKPELDGKRLMVSVDISMGDPMFAPMFAVAGIVGILAAVAVPAFMKYISKSKTSEARQFVKKLYDGGRMLSMEGLELPPNAGPTPPLGLCCGGPGDGKCMPNAELWNNPTWIALRFSVDDPHYYSYQWKTDGKNFTVSAFGDLDCDGIYSTFEMYGAMGPNGLEPSPAIFREQELE